MRKDYMLHRCCDWCVKNDFELRQSNRGIYELRCSDGKVNLYPNLTSLYNSIFIDFDYQDFDFWQLLAFGELPF